MMIAYIDKFKHQFGVEPICRTLNGYLEGGFITARGYRAAKRRLPSVRSMRDKVLVAEIKRIHTENYCAYGIRKMWHAMVRSGWCIGRDQTARLMRLAGVKGVVRGRKPLTTRPAKMIDNRPDLVNRNFSAAEPNQLWVADITYVRTLSGFVYTAFVTDVFSRKIVGWSTRSTMTTEALPLEALEQAIECAKVSFKDLIHHSDHGSQYTSIKYSERLATAGIKSSTGTVGDSYDNALAETVNGLYKTELIYSRAWRSCSEVEWATLNWVYWWNNHRLHESLGYATPEEVITSYNQHRVSQLTPV